MFLSACDTLPVSGDGAAGSAGIVEGKSSVVESGDSNVADSAAEDESAAGDTGSNPEIKLDEDMLFNLLAAEFAGNIGDIEESLKYYSKASTEIEDSRIAARTAYIALYGKDYDGALAALDRWQKLGEGSESDIDMRDRSRMYAITYLRLHQPEKAVPYVESSVTGIDKESGEEAMAIKTLLAKEASPEDAYIVLQKLNEGDKKHKHLLVLQSRYAAQLKKYDEAIALLDQVLEIDPELYDVLIIKARILAAQGKNAEAALLVKEVLDEYPDNNALRLQYARMLVEQQKMTEATAQYVVLHENLPQDGDIALSLALLYIETKDLDAAVEMFEYLIEIDKRVPVANYYLGRIAQSRDENKQAVAYFLRVNSGDYAYDAQLRVGVLLAVLGKPDEGLAKLEAMAENQTDWNLRVKSYLAQGEILRSEGRYKEGVEMYSRALQYNRDDTNLLYARGLMAEKVDRLDMTEADLLKVISKEPKNADALNALGYTLADRTSRYEEALEYIKRAAELVPDDPAILDSLGWVSYRLGKMDDALKWLSKAFSKLEDAEIAAHYGEVLWHTNQKDKAREVWKKGEKNNADNPVLRETLKRINP
ncbi:MAG: tetratricopeptide repeat protein [Proteobacteria bacterium]|nr:tetratricopeptide repeat protein [Pseudomonadota bacterium]